MKNSVFPYVLQVCEKYSGGVILKRISLLVITVSIIALLIACGSNKKSNIKDYNDNDIAAIVGEKEITMGELRFLYSDKDILGNIDGYAKFELLLQEAKSLNLDVSDDINSQKEAMLMLSRGEEDDPFVKSTREFVELQAKKLNMQPEDYYKEYVEIRSEQIAYLSAYSEKMFGKPIGYNEDELEIYNKKANDHLNELVKENKKEIKILIK